MGDVGPDAAFLRRWLANAPSRNDVKLEVHHRMPSGSFDMSSAQNMGRDNDRRIPLCRARGIEELTLGVLQLVEEQRNGDALRCVHIPPARNLAAESFDACEVLRAAVFDVCCLPIDFGGRKGMENVGAAAFRGCWRLRELRFPSTTRRIGGGLYAGSFSGCLELRALEFPTGLLGIGEWAFAGCCSLCVVHVPPGLTWLGDGAFCGCRRLASVQVPVGMRRIGWSTFCDCGFRSLLLPESVQVIERSGFWGCVLLQSLRLPDAVIEVRRRAFYRCYSLRVVTFPPGLAVIGEKAFCECSSLVAVELPAGLKELGAMAFAGCHRLRSVNLPAGLTILEKGAFDSSVVVSPSDI